MTKPQRPGAPRRATRGRNKQTTITPAQKAAGGEGAVNKHWRTYFLQHLAITSNVKASALEAGVSVSRVYKARREDTEFAVQWRAALYEGYEHLEMEVLAFLRGTAPDHKMDVANAVRLLAAHRDMIARMRAMDEDGDEQAVLDSIDAMIDAMRKRGQGQDCEDDAEAGDDLD